MCRTPHGILYKDKAIAFSKLKKWIFTHKETLKPEHLLFSFKEHVAAVQGSDKHA